MAMIEKLTLGQQPACPVVGRSNGLWHLAVGCVLARARRFAEIAHADVRASTHPTIIHNLVLTNDADGDHDGKHAAMNSIAGPKRNLENRTTISYGNAR
jgi:hypothetical protein